MEMCGSKISLIYADCSSLCDTKPSVCYFARRIRKSSQIDNNKRQVNKMYY